MRLLAIVALLVASSTPAFAEKVWIVVGASSSAPSGIARAAKPLAAKWPGGLVFRTRDCGDKRDVFGWAYSVAASAADAEAALAQARKVATGAYVKACDVAPRSLLALRVPAVDASIANVPAAVAENWDDKDRVSSVVDLPDGRVVVIKRFFDPKLLDDPDQGKDQGVWLAERDGKLRALSPSCSPAEAFTARDGKLAFQCGDSVAADELLHKVLVFEGDKQITAVSSCRSPKWAGPGALECSEESVRADGKIKLKTKKVPLGR